MYDAMIHSRSYMGELQFILSLYVHIFSSPEQVRLEQVVAMDVNFTLLTRVWCVAELVEADHLHISHVRGLLHIMDLTI